ncbi:MAG: type IV pilus twitching motility protein PilT [Desulfovibrionaceae bacterium]
MRREQFDTIIARVVRAHPELSDILMSPGRGVLAEVHGELLETTLGQPLERLSPALTRVMAEVVLHESAVHRRHLAAHGSCDLSYGLAGVGRFRVNIFRQRGNLCLVMRRLPARVPTIDSLDLPEAFRLMARERGGLALVTGGTGSGKSSSVAAVVHEISATRGVHVITLEDPVEFAHRHGKGLVNQRELHADFDSYASGLRAALRQSPAVILVGEIRDRETMAVALQAACTGHLVLSTLHTLDAGSTVGRILGLFGPQEERVARMQLAESLRFVVSQRLLPAEGGGRVAAFEILRNTLRIRELLLSGESGEKTFYNVLGAGEAHGMRTFDQSLAALYEAGRISEDTALLAATDRARLGQAIDRLKIVRGEGLEEGGLQLGGIEHEDY